MTIKIVPQVGFGQTATSISIVGTNPLDGSFIKVDYALLTDENIAITNSSTTIDADFIAAHGSSNEVVVPQALLQIGVEPLNS